MLVKLVHVLVVTALEPVIVKIIKGEMIMKYERPVMKKIVNNVKVNTNASNLSSCDGGHCVRARYSEDN